MRVFAAVFILFWAGPLANKVYEFFSAGQENRALVYWEVFGKTMQGFGDALVWLSNPLLFRSFNQAVLQRIPLVRQPAEHIRPLIPVRAPLAPPLPMHTHPPVQQSDVLQNDAMLRKRIIRIILNGIRSAVRLLLLPSLFGRTPTIVRRV
jgi:hypothetical protein